MEAFWADQVAQRPSQPGAVYLGRYLYRGVIQEKDILGCDDKGNVTFQYRDAKTTKLARRTLPGADFLWLVLQLEPLMWTVMKNSPARR